MGLWETLDYACADLCEAGYPDPWSWTPRWIFHRLAVHRRLRDQETIRQLDVSILGSRGDENTRRRKSPGLTQPTKPMLSISHGLRRKPLPSGFRRSTAICHGKPDDDADDQHENPVHEP